METTRGIPELERAWIMAALRSVLNDLGGATHHEGDLAGNPANYSTQLLTDLAHVGVTLEWLRQRLSTIGQDAGLPLRTIANAAGVAYTTVGRWADRGRLSIEPSTSFGHLDLRDDDSSDQTTLLGWLIACEIEETAARQVVKRLQELEAEDH